MFSGRMTNLMDEGVLTLQDGEEFTRWITKEGCFKSRKSHVKGVRIGKSGRQSRSTQFHMLTRRVFRECVNEVCDVKRTEL